MSTIPKDDFIEIAKKHNLDPHLIIAYIKKHIHPDYTARPGRLNERIAKYQQQGLLPLESGNSVGNGQLLKGVSTLYDASGNIKQQWVKTHVQAQNFLEAFESAVESIVSSIPSKLPVSPPTVQTSMDDLISIYPIGDAHIGMLSWDQETDETYNLDIALSRHIEAMTLLVQQAQPSTEAFIIDVGDYLHVDNYENRTTRSHAPLDAAGRYPQILEASLRLATTMIDLALTKHQIVHWRSALGNHNDVSAIALNLFIKAYYRSEPRVVVHDSPKAMYYHQFGKNLFAITHGHTIKPERIGEIMAVDCSDVWSSTKFRFAYLGHIHHQSVKEYPSCVVESFRTLAAKDAWHMASGYRSKQDMKCITLHAEHGEVGRITVNITQLS